MERPNVETILINGILYEVKFWYSTPEPQTWEYPGCDEEYDVEEIKRLTTIQELRENEDYDLEKIEELDEYELGEDFFNEVLDKLKERYVEYRDDYCNEPSDY